MVNNGYIAFALMGMVLAVPLTTPTQYKDTEYTKNIANVLPTPTKLIPTLIPEPQEPQPEPTSAPVERVIVKEVVVPIVVQDQIAAQSAQPTPEQSLIERINPAGKVYGYEKKGKK